MVIETIKPEERFKTDIGWLKTNLIFNFSHHYKDGRNGFGDLLVANHDLAKADTGFPMHPHRDMEIVTWIFEGALKHDDNGDNSGTITPGQVQQMSAGSGVIHSEVNPSPNEDVLLMQMWVLPDKKGVEPRYQEVDANHLVEGELGLVASGEFDAPIHLHNDKASFYAGRFSSETIFELPKNKMLFVYPAKGSVTIGETDYENGTAIMITDPENGLKATASDNSEIIVWSIDDHARKMASFRD